MNDTLYYDGNCPICRKEIKLLKRLVGNNVDMADIHLLSDETSGIPDKEALLKRLHLKQANGEWVIGLDATVYVWSKTPFGWLFKLLQLPLLNSITNAAYSRWAEKRYSKHYACSPYKSSAEK
jgi:predicted DCC family thiol-disulfide oxidoreductase YuxK